MSVAVFRTGQPEVARPALSIVADNPSPIARPAEPASPATAPQSPAPVSESAAASGAPVKRAYPAPAETPTQEGPKGLRFDFNDGCRVIWPEGEEPLRIRLSDIDTGNVLFETELKGGRTPAKTGFSVLTIGLSVFRDAREVAS
jgi:hypothetical protein